MDIIKFNDRYGEDEMKRLAEEFNNQLDPLARAAVLDMAYAMYAKFNVSTTITCVVRDFKTNDAVGGNPQSAHLTKRAVDIRSKDWSQEQIDWAIAYVKARWAQVMHIIHHVGGTGPHIHLNLNYPFSKEKAIQTADKSA